jgi:hypothetical protein
MASSSAAIFCMQGKFTPEEDKQLTDLFQAYGKK